MPDIKEYPIEEKKIGDWTNVAELIDFKIVRTIKGGLLGTQMADVLFIYKKKFNQSDVQQKKLHLYGEEGVVFKRALDVIMRKKNDRQRHEMMDKFNELPDAVKNQLIGFKEDIEVYRNTNPKDEDEIIYFDTKKETGFLNIKGIHVFSKI